MNIKYIAVKEEYEIPSGKRISYGIAACDEEDYSCILRSVHDICSSPEEISSLTHKMNAHSVSFLHFQEVVEDFLSDPCQLLSNT